MRAPGKKFLPRAALVVFVFVAALAVAILWQLRAPEHDPRADAIRKKGYPVTLAELNAWYQSPPAGENAAFLYTNAFAHLIDWPGSSLINQWTAESREAPGSAELPEPESVLETNREALRLFHSALSRTNSRYPLDLTEGFDLLLPHLAKVKEGTVLLTSEALVHIARHRNDEAVESFRTAGHLADSLSEEPTLISQLVRFAAWTIVCSRLETALNQTDLNFSEEQLHTLQTMILAAEKPRSFSRCMVAEQAFGYALFTERKSQRFIFGGSGSNGWRSIGPRLFIGFLRTTGVFAKDKNFFLDAMATNVAISEMPFPYQFRASQSAPAPVAPSKLYIVSRILLSATSLPRSITRHADHIAWLRITQTALAVERYRLAHTNSLPDELGQLVPDFLSSVPSDPYDGKPVRFKKLNAGFVVYSIGSDCRDDGGAPYSIKKGSVSDVTFSIRK